MRPIIDIGVALPGVPTRRHHEPARRNLTRGLREGPLVQKNWFASILTSRDTLGTCGLALLAMAKNLVWVLKITLPFAYLLLDLEGQRSLQEIAPKGTVFGVQALLGRSETHANRMKLAGFGISSEVEKLVE